MKFFNSGLSAAISAYLLWGILPLYWDLLQDVSAYEILSHRIIWSFVFMGLVIVLMKRIDVLKAECKNLCNNKKRSVTLLFVSILISINWLTYIWAVNNGHVLETSLGYYINPLVSVLLAVIVFKEKLSKAKWISVLLAFIGIVVMAVRLGELPWIAIVLSVTFALYGALKKKLQITPFSSIFLETMLVLPIAAGYIYILSANGTSHFLGAEINHTLLFMGAGVVTAVPLILFSSGANKLPLNVLGFTQYISPTMGFLLGIFYFHESFDFSKMIGFGFIWLALAVFTLGEKKL